MELPYKILVVYLCLGALYITLKLRFVGRGKYEKFKNVVDEVSVITPEKNDANCFIFNRAGNARYVNLRRYLLALLRH